MLYTLPKIFLQQVTVLLWFFLLMPEDSFFFTYTIHLQHFEDYDTLLGRKHFQEKKAKLIETCIVLRWRQLVLLEWCQSLVVSSAVWDRVLNEQTPSTGIQHPSCGGRCWKGVLVMWVRSGLKWMVMSFGLAGSAGGCALSSQWWGYGGPWRV